MTATAAPSVATLPLRPPRWVRVWVVALGLVAAGIAAVCAVPLAASGHLLVLAPVAVLVIAAFLLAWRIGGLLAATTADGRLVVRNRTRTHVLDRGDVARVEAGTRANRAGTPVAVVVLVDGTEVPVDVTMAAAFQDDQLAAQVDALRAWHRG